MIRQAGVDACCCMLTQRSMLQRFFLGNSLCHGAVAALVVREHVLSAVVWAEAAACGRGVFTNTTSTTSEQGQAALTRLERANIACCTLTIAHDERNGQRRVMH